MKGVDVPNTERGAFQAEHVLPKKQPMHTLQRSRERMAPCEGGGGSSGGYTATRTLLNLFDLYSPAISRIHT